MMPGPPPNFEMDPPPQTGPAPSHYDAFFGPGAQRAPSPGEGWQPGQAQQAAPAPVAAPFVGQNEQLRLQQQVAAGADQIRPVMTPAEGYVGGVTAYANPQMPVAPVPAQGSPPVISYPNIDAAGNPYAGYAPPAAAPAPPGVAPIVAAPQQMQTIRLQSGYEVQLSPQQISQLHTENTQLREKADLFDRFDRWGNANPQQSAQVQAIISGQQIEGPTSIAPVTPPTPADGDFAIEGEQFLDEEAREQLKPVLGRMSAMEQRFSASTQRLEVQLAQERAWRQDQTDRQMLDQVQGRLESALELHPYTALRAADPNTGQRLPAGPGSDQATREAIAELALLDVKRYGQEGVTHEDAVRKWANHFEGQRRGQLQQQVQQAAQRPAVPPVLGPGALVPQPQVPAPSSLPGGFFDSGMFNRGLSSHMNAAREAQARLQHQ